MKRLILLAVALLALTACLGPDPNLTESGQGKPRITADYPDEVDAGETFTLTLDISNPGPGDMPGVVVAFARLGDPSLPFPVVEAGAKGENEAVVGVEPEPQAVSIDGIVYTFPALEEGDSTSVSFELVAPDTDGRAGNSVQVYDARATDRAGGIRFLLTVNK